MPLTPEQRAAQRVFVGLIRVGAFELTKDRGWSIWRLKGSEEWQRSVPELSELLNFIDVPHTISIERRIIKKRPRPQVGLMLQIAWEDLDRFTAWVPSLKIYIAVLESDE